MRFYRYSLPQQNIICLHMVMTCSKISSINFSGELKLDLHKLGDSEDDEDSEEEIELNAQDLGSLDVYVISTSYHIKFIDNTFSHFCLRKQT